MLAVLIAFPLTVVIWLIARTLAVAGLHPEIAPLASSYLALVNFSLLPLLIYGACRRYLQAIGFVAPVTFALVSANLVNAFGNWILIHGHFGFPAMGTDGSALATSARAHLHGRRRDRRRDLVRLPSPAARSGTSAAASKLAWLRRLIALGGPAATQLLLEVGVFASATLLAGQTRRQWRPPRIRSR